MTDVMERTYDLYEEVVRLIEENQLDKAIRIIAEIGDKTNKVNLLSRLARTLDVDLIQDRINAHALTHALDRARALTRARARDGDVARALALARARAFDLARALTRIFDHDLALAENFNYVILHVLDAENSRVATTSESITFQDIETLTPQTLSTQIIPYLQALFNLQAIINELKRQQTISKIISISQNSPPRVVTQDTEDATDTTKSIVMLGRNNNKEALDELRIAEIRQEIAKKEIESQEALVQMHQSTGFSGIELEREKEILRQMRLENDSRELDNRERRLKLQQVVFDIAQNIIQQYHPNLPEDERIPYVFKLAAELWVLIGRSVE